MNRNTNLRGIRPFINSGIVICCLLAGVTCWSKARTDFNKREVDLKLKILTPQTGDEDEPLEIELRKSTGEIIGLAAVHAGGSVHFKHLEPNIYVVCQQGSRIIIPCKSFDLYPPQNSSKYSFTAQMTACSLRIGKANPHTVGLRDLMIPENAKKELSKSIQASLHGNSQDEIRHLKRAIAIYPEYVDALNNLGCCYRQSRDFELSAQYFARVTDLFPGCQTAWSNLGGVLSLAGEWKESLKAALRGLRLWPDSAFSNFQAALGYYQLNRYSEAKPYFKKTLLLDPESASFPMIYLGKIAFMEDRPADAEKYLKLFQSVHPHFPNAQWWVNSCRSVERDLVAKADESKLH